MMRAVMLAALLAATPAGPIWAQDSKSSVDKRIRTVRYDENAITQLTGRLGFQTVIEFDPAERIENVSIGDSVAWQITPNRRATLLFLKPVESSTTNMTVVTTLRRYVFDLRVAEPASTQETSAVYVLRFKYPPPPAPPKVTPPPPPPPPPPPVINSAYNRKGSTRIAPLRVWDDGKFTYFEFPERIEAPAISAVAPDGTEGVVNLRFQDRLIIADVVAPQFVLRLGREKTTIVNTAYAGKDRRR